MLAESEFPPTTVFEPVSDHTHTIILLHGRASSGSEFADELFAIQLSDEITLRSRFPGFRWVFPSSRQIWSSAFQENMGSWFEAHSLTDISAKADLQIPGLNESVEYVRLILDKEMERLQSSERVFVGGISQGAATGLWVLLSEPRRLAGFIGASGWLPLCEDLKKYLDTKPPQTSLGLPENCEEQGLRFVDSVLSKRGSRTTQTSEIPQTPMLLGHGLDDAYVDVELGRAAKEAVEQAGYVVQWKEYVGAEQEGHWLKEPEQAQDIARFIEYAAFSPLLNAHVEAEAEVRSGILK